MSYNITACKVKKLEDFTIPMSALYDKSIREDWLPDKPIYLNTDVESLLRGERPEIIEIEIRIPCESSITGTLENDNINVKKIDISGEGSGSAMYYILESAFKKSKGTFEALMVWEGGDTIAEYKVHDGEIIEETIS